MLAIAWKTLRARKGAFAGAFVSLLCATALIAASGILAESGLRASVSPYRYSAADAVVGGDQHLRLPGGDFTVSERLPEPVRPSADLVDALRALEEVELAVGDHHLPLAVSGTGTGEPLPVLGHGWDTAPLGPFEPVRGTFPRRAAEVALTTDLADALGAGPGDLVRITSAARPAEYRVSGTVALQGSAQGRGGSVFLHPDDVERLAPVPGAFDAIGLVAAPGVDPEELAAAVSAVTAGIPVTVHTGTAVNQVEFSDVGAARGLLMLISGSFGGLAVLIALFAVSGTLALSVDTRRRELAMLRAIGATPGQILRLVGAEALLLSLVAGAVGCLPGILVAQSMHRAFAHLGVIPHDLPLAVGPLPLVCAVLLTTLTALLGGVFAALRPAWADPVRAMSRSSAVRQAPARWRSTAGLVCLALGVSAAMTPIALRNDVGAAGTSGSALLSVMAVALLGPVLLRPLAAAVVRPLRRSRVSGFLAAEATESDLRRLGAVLTPLVLAVGFTLSMVYTQSTLARAVSVQAEEGITADVAVTDTGSGGIDADVVGALAALPEAGPVTPLRETRVFVPYSVFGDPELAAFPAHGVSSEGAGANLDPGVVDGDLGDLSGAAVALEHSGANLLGARIGDELDVRLGDGTPVVLRLVATYERGLGLGGALVPEELLDEHARPASQVLMSAADGTPPEELAAAVGTFAEGYPTLRLTDQDGFTDSARAEADLAAWVNLIGLVVILGYIAIAVVNNLVISTSARSREFALLRLTGATRGQVLRALRWEAWVIVVLALLLGTLVALFPLSVLSLALLGTPVPAGPPLVYLGVAAATAVSGVCSVMLPVRLALRTPPVEAIGLRE